MLTLFVSKPSLIWIKHAQCAERYNFFHAPRLNPLLDIVD